MDLNEFGEVSDTGEDGSRYLLVRMVLEVKVLPENRLWS